MDEERRITIKPVKMEPNEGSRWESEDVLLVPIPPEWIDIDLSEDVLAECRKLKW